MTRYSAPIKPGDKIRIPRATLVRSMNPADPDLSYTKRSQVVTVHSVLDGWTGQTLFDGTRDVTCLPHITWVGRGGYWKDAQVTDRLLEVNNLPTIELPENSDTSTDQWNYFKE